jgi:hypothetical protein
MPGPPVSIGCAVLLSPGAAGAPDSGTIVMIPPGGPTAGGMPLAVAGSMCTMVHSVTGIPYPLSIGSLCPSQISIQGQALVRIGDMIPSGSGVLTILGPPAAPYILDNTG